MAIGQPPALLAALADRLRSNDLKQIRLYYKIAMEPLATSLLAEDVIEKVDAHSFFIGGPDHEIIKRQLKTGKKLLSFVPVNFSQIPRLFEEIIALDTFIVTVSPMDGGGFFSLGTNNDFASTAARRCKRLIVEVNRNMPRVFGQSQIHVSEVAAIVENHVPLIEAGVAEPSPEDVPSVPWWRPWCRMAPRSSSASARYLRALRWPWRSMRTSASIPSCSRRPWPTWSERASSPARARRSTPASTVFTVAFGTTDSYAFMNDNSAFESYASSYVNDIRVIAQHDDFISVNTAIEIDLYGQVNAEFIGEHEYSGSGGQFDFVKGASLAKRGKSIIAIQSTARKGTVSSIVPKVAMVTDLRMDVEWVVTEHGAVNLRGKSTKERALALIGIAHPAFRDELTSTARKVTLI